MAYDEVLAARIRGEVSGLAGLSEKAMFGGVAFLLRGNMLCGVVGASMCARVGPQAFGDCSEEPHTRPFDFSGRPMKGWLYVDPPALADDAGLRGWIARCRAFVETLPPR